MKEFSHVVIIGAGFAGASTACHLVRSGVRNVLIIERESFPGVHASGRNAGMIRQIIPDEALAPIVREGAEFIRKLPAEWPLPVEFRQTGSLLLGSGSAWEKLKADAGKASKAGVFAENIEPSRARQRVPVLENTEFEGAVWCSTDGVVDIHALLQGYLSQAQAGGVKIMTSTKVVGIESRHGGVVGVATDSGPIEADLVINAGGAWAMELARMAGASPVPAHPYRRHLFTTDLLPWVRQEWPYVWNLTGEFYFRPESGGLLLSACDETKHFPGIPPADPEAPLGLYDKLQRYPGLQNVSIRKTWACLRTMPDDGRFVIGWDPHLHGFFWVSGLGGHGVTASGAVGRLAADLILGREKEPLTVSPSRFFPS